MHTRPQPRRLGVPLPILLHQPRRLGVQRAIRIRLDQQTLDRHQYPLHPVLFLPVLFQTRNANLSRLGNIRVEDGRSEPAQRWARREVDIGKVEGYAEVAPGIRCTRRTTDPAAEGENVGFGERDADVWRRITLE